MGNTHTKYELHPSRWDGHIVFTSQNWLKYQIFINSQFSPKNDPTSAPKSIGFLYSSWESYTPNFDLIGLSILDLSCLQAKIHRNIDFSQIPNFFSQRWPSICTKINRLPVLLIRKLHTKFRFDQAEHSELIVFTSQNLSEYRFLTNSQFFPKNDPPSAPKWIGFLYSSWEATHQISTWSGWAFWTNRVYKPKFIGISISHKSQIFPQKWPPICTKINRLPVLLMRKVHTKFRFDRAEHSGLIVFTSQNSSEYRFLTNSQFSPKNAPPSAPKSIGFLYSS